MQHFSWYYSNYDLTESLTRCEAETPVNPYDCLLSPDICKALFILVE